MPISKQPLKNRIIFIDYEPAEVKEMTGDNWRIVFKVKIPGANKMKRYRRRVKPMSNKKNRLQHAKRICQKINEKLAQGWSPLIDDSNSAEYFRFVDILDKYIAHCNELKARNALRPRTADTYISMAGLLKKYCDSIGQSGMLTQEYGQKFVRRYLDHIYMDKKRSARTTNNYLKVCVTIGNYMVDRGYLSANTVSKIPKMVEQKKKREIIDDNTLREIITHLKKYNKKFLTICLVEYYCFIRRTEMTKLRVRHINLSAGTIFIPADISKNKKDDTVTIPKPLMNHLANHLTRAKQSDYVFSDHLGAGEMQLQPKKISDQWARMRKKLNFKETYQFYSLKDTGITKLFLMGIPTIKIRDQARHHDIKITETYTPRNSKRDDAIFNIENDIT